MIDWLCLIIALISAVNSQNSLIVTSPAGTFQGAEMTSHNGDKMAAYRGIPYAQPPVGDLRFARPQRMANIQGVYNTTVEGPMCIQPPNTHIGGEGIGQEDCLYLNVFTPLNSHHSNGSQDSAGNTPGQLKVLVYIHGGGWAIGSANQFVPGDLVVQANVIVVTLNYRLSWLGFLKGYTPEVPGNQGTWDQLMALEWVKVNIGAFGGDVMDITLAGESSGSASVSLLAIVQQAKNLFTKGILMSATAFVTPTSAGSTDSLLPTLAHTLGCTNSSAVNMSQAQIEDVVKCLKALPAERFSLPQLLTARTAITIDGDLFLAPIMDLLKNQTYLEDVGFYRRNYLVSSTNNEGTIAYSGMRFPIPGEKSEYDRISRFLGIPLPVFEKMLLWYSHPNTSENAPLLDLLTDNAMMPAVWRFLEVHAGNRSQGSSSGHSYFMRFEHYPAYMPWPYKGVFHGVDLTYLFDTTPREILQAYYYSWLGTDQGFTQEDESIKAKLISLVHDFVQGTHDVWQPYDLQNETYTSFGSITRLKQHPLKARRDFWKITVPQWLTDPSNTPTVAPTTGSQVKPCNGQGRWTTSYLLAVGLVLLRCILE